MTIYLDHNATTPVKAEILEHMNKFYMQALNPSSIHSHGRLARKLMEASRNQVKDLLGLGASDQYKVIFTSSGSEANNLALHNFINLPVLIAATEHPSILKSAINAKHIAVNQNGLINLDKLEQELEQIKGKKLISIMLANNETGVINDLTKISELCHKYDGYVHTDASAAIGKIPVNLLELGVDLMTISAHKFGGPMGAAALIANDNIKLSAQIKGGGQEQGVRSGTENVPAIIGFGLACELVSDNLNQASQIESLRNLIEEELSQITNIIIFGKQVRRIPNTICFTMPGVTSDLQLIHFDLNQISVSSGAACSSGKVTISHVLLAMDVKEADAKCAIRVSLGHNTTKKEAIAFINCWKDLHAKQTKINKKIVSL